MDSGPVGEANGAKRMPRMDLGNFHRGDDMADATILEVFNLGGRLC